MSESTRQRPQQAEILLVGINAAWIHASMGLRCLRANLGDLRDRSAIFETTIKQRPLVIAEQIVAFAPRIVGIGMYVWNAREVTDVARLLKRLAPDVAIVLGGPEISYETSQQPVVDVVDHVVAGEAEVAFRQLCGRLLEPSNGDAAAADEPPKVIRAPLPDAATMALPYDEYDAGDLARRVVYVEASRGCPFACQFCLSALDKKVRAIGLQRFLAAMDGLLARGLRRFKFVDRTFNLHIQSSAAILRFFLERIDTLQARDEHLFLHFEMVPDRFPDQLRTLVERFPRGALQFEVGVQSLDETVGKNIARRQDTEATLANLRWLVERTHAHVHADLIVGLPGEGLDGFAAGFDRLWGTGVHEIQVGILKRLRGAPIAVHQEPRRMVYSPLPPYEILRSDTWTSDELARMRRFARWWNDVVNSGRWPATIRLLLDPGSPFGRFMALVDWMIARGEGHGAGISLQRWARLLTAFLVEQGAQPDAVEAAVASDLARAKQRQRQPSRATPARQARHRSEVPR